MEFNLLNQLRRQILQRLNGVAIMAIVAWYRDNFIINLIVIDNHSTDGTTEAIDAFKFLQNEVPRNFPIQASLKNIGTYNESNGELGLFTGKVGLAVYNKKGKLVKVVEFKDPALQWTSMHVTKDLRFNNINLSELPNGKYTIMPVFNELVAKPDKFSGWQPIAYSNTQTLVVSKHKVSVESYDWKDRNLDYTLNANVTLSTKGK